jgi:hypothetical protein
VAWNLRVRFAVYGLHGCECTVVRQRHRPTRTSESDAAKYLTAALLYERTNAAAGAGAMRAMTAREDIEIARFRGMREEE